MKVQQELMRHASIQTTVNVYGQAMSSSKKEANGKIWRWWQFALRSFVRYAGGPNQVVSASARPTWVRSATQPHIRRGRTKTAVGAVTAPIAGCFHVPTYLASIN
jgi:hypothetical protein